MTTKNLGKPHSLIVHWISILFSFFNVVYNLIYRLNKKIGNMERKTSTLYAAFCIISFMLAPSIALMALLKNGNLSNTLACFILIIIFVATFTSTVELLYKSCHSVLFNLTFWVFFNLCFSVFVALIICAIMDISDQYMIFPISFISYSLMWVCFSLVADAKVARLSNEIISGLLTLIFTITTYTASLYTDETQLVITVAGGLLLPFIVLSVISIIAVNCKEYWEEKYNRPQNK